MASRSLTDISIKFLEVLETLEVEEGVVLNHDRFWFFDFIDS